MQNAIDKQLPIDIELNAERDATYSGICLKQNDELTLLLNFDYDMGEYNGFTIVRTSEIDEFSIWEEEDLQDIKNDNKDAQLAGIDLSKINTFADALEYLKQETLISIFVDEDEEESEGYLVGKVRQTEDGQLHIRLIDEASNWLDTEIIPIATVHYIGFRTQYEFDLAAPL
jgi:hypothetical protein